jgi:hypothetical protein
MTLHFWQLFLIWIAGAIVGFLAAEYQKKR